MTLRRVPADTLISVRVAAAGKLFTQAPEALGRRWIDCQGFAPGRAWLRLRLWARSDNQQQ
jgi:hypothetical protein